MQRFITFSTCIFIASLYIIKRFDPGNILLWFTTMNSWAIVIHYSAVVALLFVGIKGQVENNALRRFILALGFGTILFAFAAIFTPLFSFIIKPLDFTLLSLAGISLSLVGLYIPAELEFVPSKPYSTLLNISRAFGALNPKPLIDSTASTVTSATKPKKVTYNS